MGRDGLRFRVKFWPAYLAAVLSGQAGAVAALGGGAGLMAALGPPPPAEAVALMLAGTAAGVAVLIAPVVLVLVHTWPVRVSPIGVGGTTVWGLPAVARWDAVRAVKPVNLAGLPYLRVYPTDSRRAVWVPLFLTDAPGFAAAVADLAGDDHPVARAARARTEEPT